MATAILSPVTFTDWPLPTVTAEQLDERYPAPSWATTVHGTPERDGWAWDHSEYVRFLVADGCYFNITVSESCGPDGSNHQVDQPVLFMLDNPDIDDNAVRCTLEELSSDVDQLWRAMRPIDYYVAHGTMDGHR